MFALIVIILLIALVGILAFLEAHQEKVQLELEHHTLEVSSPAEKSTLTVDRTQTQRVLKARGQ